MSHLECYLYGSGDAHSASAPMTTYHRIGIDEGGGVNSVRMNSSGRFTDALNTWQTNANSHSGTALTYSFSVTGGQVTVSASGNFTIHFYGMSGKLLGFSNASYSGASTYTSDTTPSGWIELVGYECEPLAPGSRVDLLQYRHGRAVALGFGNVDLFRTNLFFNASAYGHQISQDVGDGAGYSLTGRVRIQGADSAAYSATNPDGYVDGYIVETPELETFGNDERFARIRVVVAVPR